MTTEQPVRRSGGSWVLSVLLKGVLPIVIVGAGVLGAVQLIKTAPQAKQRPPRHTSTLVAVRAVAPSSEPVVIEAMGTVIPAREVVVVPQVTGTVLDVHPALVAGGRLAAGEALVKLDPADYQVALRQAEASLARTKAQLFNAERELERIRGLQEQSATNRKEIDDTRTARDVAEANLAAAEATLEKAKLDLSRTTLIAPFDCVVVSEQVDVGSLVTPQTQVATLVGTDEYWVQATVPVEQLRWIPLPERGEDGAVARVQQRLGPGVTSEWTGRVTRLLSDLEPQGRMARLLITVRDPLSEASAAGHPAPLLIGAYVDVAIEGRALDNVFRLARSELRSGDQVWVMNDDGELEIRPVEVAFRGREEVAVRSGIATGDRLVLTDLPAPVAGMALETSAGVPGVAQVDAELEDEHAGAGGPS